MTPQRYMWHTHTCTHTSRLPPTAPNNVALSCSSTQKLDFLRVVGLTTVSRRDDLVQQKRRKRRRMLRERSPSPPVSQSKRTPPLPQLNTRFTPEEMDQAPELEDKKRFLTMFRLSHVTAQQRKGRRWKTTHQLGHSVRFISLYFTVVVLASTYSLLITSQLSLKLTPAPCKVLQHRYYIWIMSPLLVVSF